MSQSYTDINSVLKEARQGRLRRSIGEARTFLYGPHAISVKEFKELNERSSVSEVEEKLTDHLFDQIRGERDRGDRRWNSRYNFDDKTVLQLGSGVGLAGIFLKQYAPTAKISIAEGDELLPLVTENVRCNGHSGAIDLLRLELAEDLDQSHIAIRAHDFILAVLDIYNAPELAEKLFRAVLALSGPETLLFVAYKRYLKPDERNPRKRLVEDFENKEAAFRSSLGRAFSLQRSLQAIYRLSPQAEVVVTEIPRTAFSSFLQQ